MLTSPRARYYLHAPVGTTIGSVANGRGRYACDGQCAAGPVGIELPPVRSGSYPGKYRHGFRPGRTGS